MTRLPSCVSCGHEYRLHIIETDDFLDQAWCGGCKSRCHYVYPPLKCVFCDKKIGPGQQLEPRGHGSHHRSCWGRVSRTLLAVHEGWDPPPGAMVPGREEAL